MTVADLVELIERIGKLKALSDDQRERLVTAALLEFDGAAQTMPRVARTNRYGKPMKEILSALSSKEPLTAYQIAQRAMVDRERVNSALTKLYTTGRVERMDLPVTSERGPGRVGAETVYGYVLKVETDNDDSAQDSE